MHLIRKTSRRRALLGGLATFLALVAISGVVSVRSASAYVPDADLAGAVRQEIPAWYPANLQDIGPDGIPGPDGTPDGLGAFQYFQVPDNQIGRPTYETKGVYAYRVTPYVAAMLAQYLPYEWKGETVLAREVRAAILGSWAQAGWENGFGYPLNDARGATDADISRGCRYGDDAQYFMRITGAQAVHLMCRDYKTGAISWRRLWG
jgi:hypothetical protein